MTADTQAQGDLVRVLKLAKEVGLVGWVSDDWTMFEFSDHQIISDKLLAFAAALQGRGTQEGEPSEALGVEVAPEFQAEVDRMSEEAIARWAAVRKDAERYQWLRSNGTGVHHKGGFQFATAATGSCLDETIDAALAQESRVSVEIREAM